jgi:hypothetical protein
MRYCREARETIVMRSRQWIGMVALLGVLLHAGAVVRHHGLMLGLTFQHQALVSDLAQICHGALDVADASTADLPTIPRPSDAQHGCPLCSGLGAAFALLAPKLTAVALPEPVVPAFHSFEVLVPSSLHAVHPPARGPPAFV